MSLSSSVLDFGALVSDANTVRSLIVKNSGGGTLQIAQIKSSCGCTAVDASKSELWSGEECEITVTLSAPNTRGPGTESFVIKSNDPINPYTKVFVKYSGVRYSYIEPSHIDFGRVKTEELPAIRHARLVIPLHKEKDEVISGIDIEEKFVTCQIANGRDLTFVLAQNAPLGELVAKATIRFHGLKLEIPIRAVNQGPLHAVPKSVIVGPIGSVHEHELASSKVWLHDAYSDEMSNQVEITGVLLSDSLKGYVIVESIKKNELSGIQLSVLANENDAVLSRREKRGNILVTAATVDDKKWDVNIPVVVIYKNPN